MDGIRKEGIEWLKAVLTGVVIFVIIQLFFFTNYEVEGGSMQPTLQDGDKLVVNKLLYNFSDIDRFDIVIFHANEEEDYVKRVIGLPGDNIEYNNDQLFINGEYIEETYLRAYSDIGTMRITNDFSYVVPNGYVFVLGDNRLQSYDSRHFGFVPIEKIIGKVDIRYWPIEEWQFTFGY